MICRDDQLKNLRIVQRFLNRRAMRRRLSVIARAAVFMQHQALLPACVAEMIVSEYCYCRALVSSSHATAAAASESHSNPNAPPRGNFCVIQTEDYKEAIA